MVRSSPVSLFEVGQKFGAPGDLKRMDHVSQITFHHGQKLVKREVDPVVGQAPLREVVCSNAVASIAAADQPFARGRFFGCPFAALFLLQPRGEHLQGFGLVAVLAVY